MNIVAHLFILITLDPKCSRGAQSAVHNPGHHQSKDHQ